MKGGAYGLRALAVLSLATVLAACTSAPVRAPAPPQKPGGYYLDDGPGANPPANLDRIPDAEPKAEPIKASTGRPYTVFGRTYSPMARLEPYKARGRASWYGKRYHGQPTASGEPYDMYAMTAAHRTLPIPSYARVTNLRTGKAVIVRVNDRGPFRGDRLIDLSYTAAYKLGIVGSGSDLVEVESIVPGEPLPPPALESHVAPIQAVSVKMIPQATPTTPSQPQSAAPPLTQPRESPMAQSAQTAMAQSAQTAMAQGAETPVAQSAETPLAQGLESSVPQETKGVFVQLGAFSLRSKAEAFLARMRSEMSWLDDATRLYARDGLFRVCAGPYADSRQADQVATRIEQTTDIRPIVIAR